MLRGRSPMQFLLRKQRTSLTTPSAPLRLLRAIFLVAQPPLLWRPLEEGNSSRFNISSFWAERQRSSPLPNYFAASAGPMSDCLATAPCPPAIVAPVIPYFLSTSP